MGNIKNKYLNTVHYLGGIGAIVTGLGVVCVAAGFFSLQANANLLGISNVFHHNIESYVFEGGAFFTFVILWLAPLLGIFIAVISKFWPQNEDEGSTKKDSSKDATKDAQSNQGSKINLTDKIRVCLFILAPIISTSIVYRIRTNYLIEPSVDTVVQQGGKGLFLELSWVTHGYSLLLFSLLLSSVFCIFYIFLNRKKENEKLSIVEYIGVVSLVFQLAILPVFYGKYIHLNEFHVVKEIKFKSELQNENLSSNTIWLLGYNTTDAVLYFGNKHQIKIIPTENIAILTLGSKQNIIRVD